MRRTDPSPLLPSAQLSCNVLPLVTEENWNSVASDRATPAHTCAHTFFSVNYLASACSVLNASYLGYLTDLQQLILLSLKI